MIFVGGNSGAGKTTLLRTLVCELRDEWSAETHSARNNATIAWLELKNVRVFGRFVGFHKTKESASTRWGKIDGCDRLHPSSVAMCRKQLITFQKQNVKLIICDGPRLLQQETLDIAARLGYNIRILEVKTPPEVAVVRKRRREPELDNAAICQNVWPTIRKKFCMSEGFESLTQDEVLRELREVVCKALGRNKLPHGLVSVKKQAAWKPVPYKAKLSPEALQRRRAADVLRKRAALAALYKKPAAHARAVKHSRALRIKNNSKRTVEQTLIQRMRWTVKKRMYVAARKAKVQKAD